MPAPIYLRFKTLFIWQKKKKKKKKYSCLLFNRQAAALSLHAKGHGAQPRMVREVAELVGQKT